MRLAALARPLLAAAACFASVLAGPSSAAPPDTSPAWERIAPGSRDGEVGAVALAPDGRRLAVGDARGVLLRGEEGGSFERVLRRGPVHDLAFASGSLYAATERGLYRIDARGDVTWIAPGPGGSARSIRRIAACDGALAVSTAGGVFLSKDGDTWQRVSTSQPSAEAGAVALRCADDAFELWAVLGGELWRSRLRESGRSLLAEASERIGFPFAASDGGPLELIFDAPGADALVLFPAALALRRAEQGEWEVLRPSLPPGATASRIAWAAGRFWLASDRGLLESGSLSGPWRRARPPAGSAPVLDLAAAGASVFAATPDGLMAARESAAGAAPSPPRPLALRAESEPSIALVHRYALAYLDLRPSRMRSMARGVSRRGWLPVVGLQVARDADRSRSTDWDEAFTSGAQRLLVDRDRERSSQLELSLTFAWDLGDVAYHPEEIDVSRETREVIELRDDVLDEITQLYYERLRTLAELAALPDPDDPAALRLRLRADELAAGIDAWTGGWFGRQVPRLTR